MISGPSHREPFDRHEPIPGYRTTDLLGRGGFGEVWKAIAPGGISKAVKIIYGDSDPTKAEGELRALARIKDVRHPLLLSIERIEMCAGNLVIVTELADGSLKDRFLQLRQNQSVGVPQEELLRYIGDAADALDFLYENYSLQHLDVKPENILLLSGRAKLGDFGLVKNLYERSASMVGGLTPTYASPELFDGKPSRHSDQYGLALVYFQMLTGVLPFPTGSTAQLANAHLRGVPDLSALPRSQRSVIARALSKVPAQRYPSCVALTTAIRESLGVEVSAPTPPPIPAPAPVPAAAVNRPPVGQALDTGMATPATVVRPVPPAAPRTGGAAAAKPPAAAITTISNASQPTVAARSTAGAAPTVLIGVGGLGVEVLARLVARLNDRYGPASQWPPVEIIVLDCHTRSLSSRFREQDLDRVQVVPIPLKSADEYGTQTPELLKWLGRRWFYNIPRDLTTNGYRPFGRLALVSNGARVKAALARVIGRAAGSGQPPNVTIIGGIGGGTGSGAIPDLAYAVRSELKRGGFQHEHLRGVLLHATPRSHAERDKSRANAHALLRELHHYSAPGGHYPGEPHLNALPFHGDNAAFSETLLFQLGEELGQAEWELAVEQTAEFLYAANFTPAGDLLHGPDHDAETERDVPPHAHRAQVIALGAGGSATIAAAVQTAADDVIRFWREGRNPPPATHSSGSVKTLRLAALTIPDDGDTVAADNAVRQQFKQCQLNLEQLTADGAEVIRLESGAALDEFLGSLVDQALAVTNDSATGVAQATEVLNVLDRCLRSDFRDELDDAGDEQLFLQIAGRLNVRTRGRINALFAWVLKMVDSPEQRLDGARRIALAIQRQLQELQVTALQQAQVRSEAADVIGNTTRGEDFHRPERRSLVSWTRRVTPEQKLHAALRSYAAMRLDEFLLRVTAKIARIVDAEVTTLVELLDRFSRDLARLSTSVPGAGGNADDNDLLHSSNTVLAYRAMLREQLQLRRYDIAKQIDDLAGQQLVARGTHLSRFLDPVGDLHQDLWHPVLQTARRCVMDCIQDINRQLLAVGQPGTECQSMRRVMDLLRAELLSSSHDSADQSTQCLVIPVGTDSGTLGTLSSRMRIVEGPLTDITLSVIGRGVPLSELANELTGGQELYKELGSRLQTRGDIEWRDLDEPVAVGHAPAEDQFAPLPV